MSWEQKKIGEICVVRRGTSITQKQAKIGLVPVIAGGLKPAYFHNQANRLSPTISISGSGANAGYVNLWPEPIFASDCSTVEVTSRNISLLFVYYFLKSRQDYIYAKLRSGAAQPHVYAKDIAELLIPLPPLATQEKLVTKLDAIFAEIDKATAAAEANIKNAEALLSAYISQSFNDLKKSHNYIKLGDICTGVDYGSSVKSELTGKVPVLRMGNILNGDLDFSNLVYTNNDEEIQKYKLNKFDVLFNRTNSPLHVGKSAVFFGTTDTIFAGYLIRINYDKSKILPQFLNYYLNSREVREYGYSVMAHSINQANINGTKLKSYPVLLPKLETQNEIVINISLFKEYCNSLINQNVKKLESINALKQSILQQAFNGELIKE